MTASREGPSLLLKHIHYHLSALAKVYEQSAVGASSAAASSKPKTSISSAFPTEPTTPEGGERVLRFFCEELGMGIEALSTWRHQLREAINNRWGFISLDSQDGSNDADHFSRSNAMMQGRREDTLRRTTLASSPEFICAQPGLEAGISTIPAASRPAGARGAGGLWFMPREADAAFVNACRAGLKAIVSPLVTLSPPGQPMRVAALDASQSSPQTYSQTSRFYATRHIPAGMFVLSLPTEAVFFADPPHATDPLLAYFIQLEDLVGQLLSVCDDPEAPHFGYVQYLKKSVVPVRNLPFLSRGEIHKMLGATAAADKHVSSFPFGSPTATPASQVSETERHATRLASSPALSLWDFYHQDMKGEPLSPYVRNKLRFPLDLPSEGAADAGLEPSKHADGKAEYAWWMSLVLSRREGGATLIPLVDKLNHSPLPNTYFTMSTPDSFCGIDVLDNMLAGVQLDLLYHPYVHVFTIRDVQPGEELTLCYASAPDGMYRPSPGAVTPPKLASLNEGSADNLCLASQRRKWKTNAMKRRLEQSDRVKGALFEDVLAELFPEEKVRVLGQAPCTPCSGVGCGFPLRYHLHPGPQLVQTPDGKAIWQLQWGFVPSVDAIYSAPDLRELGALVAERRVDSRAMLFPPTGVRKQLS